MSTPSTYKLSIEAVLPRTAVEGRIFKATHRIKNIGESHFPGGDISLQVSWPNIGPSLAVGYSIYIEELKPNETFEFARDEAPATSGMTIITYPGDIFKANNGVPIALYLPDGRKLVPGQLIGGIRARSHEEISQARAIWIAVGSLLVLLIFQILDWLIRFYWHF